MHTQKDLRTRENSQFLTGIFPPLRAGSPIETPPRVSFALAERVGREILAPVRINNSISIIMQVHISHKLPVEIVFVFTTLPLVVKVDMELKLLAGTVQ